MGPGDDFSSVILVKRNLPAVLRREVTRASWAHERVAIGTATDPYQPIEGEAQLTRRSLEVLIDAHTPVSITTKGPLVVRDADLLAQATAGAGAMVFISVPSVDDAAWRHLEPGTAPPLQRIRAAGYLRRRGVDARVLMMPLVPGITTPRPVVERTLQAIAAAGVPLAGAGVAHLDAGTRPVPGLPLAHVSRSRRGLWAAVRRCVCAGRICQAGGRDGPRHRRESRPPAREPGVNDWHHGLPDLLTVLWLGSRAPRRARGCALRSVDGSRTARAGRRLRTAS